MAESIPLLTIFLLSRPVEPVKRLDEKFSTLLGEHFAKTCLVVEVVPGDASDVNFFKVAITLHLDGGPAQAGDFNLVAEAHKTVTECDEAECGQTLESGHGQTPGRSGSGAPVGVEGLQIGDFDWIEGDGEHC